MRRAVVLVALAACGAPRPSPPVPFETALEATPEKPPKRGYVCPEGDRLPVPSGKPTPPVAASAPPSSSAAPPTPSAAAPTPSVKPRFVKMRETGTEIQGRLRPEFIKRILRSHFPRIRACYERLLKREPSSVGVVATEFVVGVDGHTEWADVRSPATSLVDEELLGCMERVFACLSYPAPDKGRVFVRYPLAFEMSD